MTTKIEWVRNNDGTQGETWNPVVGCTRVSKGCEHCYAERMAKRQIAMGNKNYAGTVDEHGRWSGKVKVIPDALEKPLHWRKPRRVFVCSMSDLFHQTVPESFIGQVFDVMGECRRHTFQTLTKRSGRMYWIISKRNIKPMPNVHLGVSVEDQASADRRIPWLLKTPAAVRWVSLEPMLGPVGLGVFLGAPCWEDPGTHESPERPGPFLYGIVVGGESGPGARPMNLDWVRSVRDQCQEAGVKFFFKQMMVGGKKVSLPELDGRTWGEWPADATSQESG